MSSWLRPGSSWTADHLTVLQSNCGTLHCFYSPVIFCRLYRLWPNPAVHWLCSVCVCVCVCVWRPGQAASYFNLCHAQYDAQLMVSLLPHRSAQITPDCLTSVSSCLKTPPAVSSSQQRSMYIFVHFILDLFVFSLTADTVCKIKLILFCLIECELVWWIISFFLFLFL